jgi:sec-independent protein translocase protein TatA
MMDVFSPTHLLILLVLVLVLFGPSKLGDLGGALGRAIHDFKNAIHEPAGPHPAGTEPAETKPYCSGL